MIIGQLVIDYYQFVIDFTVKILTKKIIIKNHLENKLTTKWTMHMSCKNAPCSKANIVTLYNNRKFETTWKKEKKIKLNCKSKTLFIKYINIII